MIWALLFFLGFCAVAFGAAVLVGRGGRKVSFTGPKRRTVDYDHPYGSAEFFWTGGGSGPGRGR